MFCTRCGHRNPDDAHFCAECGHPLQGDVTVSLPPVETDDEPREAFPFPYDQLEPGQGLLLVTRGPNVGSTFLLAQAETTVGRDVTSDVFLDDVTVSRAHAILEREDSAAWFVRDVGSLNGTYVNGEQVERTVLSTGDEVQIGRFKLTFFSASD